MSNRIGSAGTGPVEIPPHDDPPSTTEDTLLARAIATQHENTVVPQAQLEAYAAKSPRQRAFEANERIDRAIRTATDALDGWVTEKDAQRALEALAFLRPEELGRALWTLQQSGDLDTLVSDLSPEQLLTFTRMLSTSGIFPWKPAVDESGRPRPGAPNLIELHDRLPNGLRALAHDINLGVARRHPELVLYEPGAHGDRLDPKQRHWFDWVGGIKGKVDAFLNRFEAVTDVDGSVRQLRPGDSYRLTAEASLEVGLGESIQKQGAKVSVGPVSSRGIEVSRNEHGAFTVSADASLLGKLSASIGSSALADLKAELSQGGGGKVEFTFKSADEASRAAQLLLEAHASPMAFSAHMALDKSARGLLLDHASAIELSPEAAAKLGIEGPEKFLFKGKKAEVGGKVSTAFRIELDNGRPKALSAKSSVQFEASGSSETKLGAEKIHAKVSRSGEATVRAEIEQRVELKPGMTLRQAGRDALDARATMTVALESKSGGAFGESANELEYKVEGNPEMMFRAAVALAQGDSDGALGVIEKAEVTSRKTASTGLSLSLGGEVDGNGGSLALRSFRKRQLEKKTEEGPGREMAMRLLRSLSPEADEREMRPIERHTVRPD